MKKMLTVLLIVSTQTCSGNNISIESMDNTLTGKEELTIQERMQDKQLEFERQKLLLDAKINEQPSQMSGKTKTFLYCVSGAFILGTVGTLRKFTWVSNKFFKSKDWTTKKASDLWHTMIHGREVKISANDYERLKKEINTVNEQLRNMRAIEEQRRTENPEEIILEEFATQVFETQVFDIPEEIEMPEDIVDDSNLEDDDFYTEEEFQEAKRKYDESSFFYDGKGFHDTKGMANEDGICDNSLKGITNKVVDLPIGYANAIIRIFTKKQLKYWRPFKKEN